jgi:hypothetical protein
VRGGKEKIYGGWGGERGKILGRTGKLCPEKGIDRERGDCDKGRLENSKIFHPPPLYISKSMADSDSPTPKPPPPPKAAAKHKTSTVPLKKETVRITLKARPQGDDETATAPTSPAGGVSEDTATAPVAAPAGPRSPAVRPAGAKTIPLAKAPAARPAGAKTIPLAKAPAAGRPTQALAAARPATGARPLPKATVQLQKSQPLAGGQPPTAELQKAGIPGAAVTAVTENIEVEDAEDNIMPFAILVLILAIVVLGIELWTKFGG